MKTNNRLMGNSIITESSRIVLLVMNTISVDDDLAYSQRIATGNLTEADKVRQAGENLAVSQAREDDVAKIAAEDKAAADKIISDKVAADKIEVTEKLRLENEAKGITTDKDGNQVDKEGKILKTKAEIDKETANEDGIDTDKLPLVDVLVLKSGIEILDDKGVKKVYADTEEGLLEFSNDLAEIKAEKTVNEFFEGNPDIKAFYEHLEKGGTKESFFKTKEKLGEVDITDDKGKEEAILRNLKIKGFDDKRAKGWLKMVIDSNGLEAEAKVAETELKAYDAEVEKATADQAALDQQNHLNKVKAHWDKINNIVANGKLVNYEIPETDRKPFFEFIGRRIDAKGNTAMTLKKEELPLEQHIEIDYLIYKGFDFSQLVKSQVAKEKATTLRERLKKSTGISATDETKHENAKGPVDFGNVSVAEVHKMHNDLLEKTHKKT